MTSLNRYSRPDLLWQACRRWLRDSSPVWCLRDSRHYSACTSHRRLRAMQSSHLGALIPPNSQVGTGNLCFVSRLAKAYTGSLTYAALDDPSSGFWQLDSTGITVNGKSTSALAKKRTFIFDSGTSNIVLPQADTVVRHKYPTLVFSMSKSDTGRIRSNFVKHQAL